MRVSFSLTIGAWSANSADDPRTELVALETISALGSADARCRIVLYSPPAAKGGGAGIAGAASAAVSGAASAVSGLAGGAAPGGGGSTFSTKVRGADVALGDPITVELTAGDVTETVMTATVESVRSTLGETTIVGRGDLGKLGATRVNAIYTNQTAQQIASDLASQSGAKAGDLETGDTYPYFVVHESATALEHLRRVARLEGMDLYTAPDGTLTMKRFTKQSADHTFRYAVDILDARLVHHDAPTAQVLVAGESPASSRGTDSWHLVAKDIAPFKGTAGSGARTVALTDGAVRTSAAAQRLADATLGAIGAYVTWGRLTVLGNPRVKLGDAVAVQDAPDASLNGTFKVVAVRHHLTKPGGYVTVIDVTALPNSAPGLGAGAGALAGAAAGALGL